MLGSSKGLPPRGARGAEDPLLSSVNIEPSYTSEGVPILNEWDLVEESEWRDESPREAPVPTFRTAAPDPIPATPAERRFFDDSEEPQGTVEEDDWAPPVQDNRLLWIAIAVLGPLIILALGQAFKG